MLYALLYVCLNANAVLVAVRVYAKKHYRMFGFTRSFSSVPFSPSGVGHALLVAQHVAQHVQNACRTPVQVNAYGYVWQPKYCTSSAQLQHKYSTHSTHVHNTYSTRTHHINQVTPTCTPRSLTHHSYVTYDIVRYVVTILYILSNLRFRLKPEGFLKYFFKSE